MIQIDVISDTVCPWCYIGKRRLEQALAARAHLPVRVSWRPFQLNPDFPRDGLDRTVYMEQKFGSVERAERVYQSIVTAGQAEKIAFCFDTIRRQPNTFDAHRLVRWAADSQQQDVVVEALFHRYFMEGADVGDREVLIEIANDAGMDGGLVGRLLAQNADADLIREEEDTARRMGINGVPCFIVNRKYAVSGAQEATVLIKILDLVRHEQEQTRILRQNAQTPV